MAKLPRSTSKAGPRFSSSRRKLLGNLLKNPLFQDCVRSTDILRKLIPGEAFETFGGQTQRLEIYHAGNPLNLKVGDDVIVRSK